jgi:hypothetical protein
MATPTGKLTPNIAAIAAPAKLQPFTTIDRSAVVEELRRELLIVPVGGHVWVFDAPRVVNSTVSKTEQGAHTGEHDGTPSSTT